jgi:hypothetical protein
MAWLDGRLDGFPFWLGFLAVWLAVFDGWMDGSLAGISG